MVWLSAQRRKLMYIAPCLRHCTAAVATPHTLQAPTLGLTSSIDSASQRHERIEANSYFRYYPHTVTVYNRATTKVLIYLCYEYDGGRTQ